MLDERIKNDLRNPDKLEVAIIELDELTTTQTKQIADLQQQNTDLRDVNSKLAWRVTAQTTNQDPEETAEEKDERETQERFDNYIKEMNS